MSKNCFTLASKFLEISFGGENVGDFLNPLFDRASLRYSFTPSFIHFIASHRGNMFICPNVGGTFLAPCCSKLIRDFFSFPPPRRCQGTKRDLPSRALFACFTIEKKRNELKNGPCEKHTDVPDLKCDPRSGRCRRSAFNNHRLRTTNTLLQSSVAPASCLTDTAATRNSAVISAEPPVQTDEQGGGIQPEMKCC